MKEKKIKWHITQMNRKIHSAKNIWSVKYGQKTHYFEKQIEVANRILKQNQ